MIEIKVKCERCCKNWAFELKDLDAAKNWFHDKNHRFCSELCEKEDIEAYKRKHI